MAGAQVKFQASETEQYLAGDTRHQGDLPDLGCHLQRQQSSNWLQRRSVFDRGSLKAVCTLFKLEQKARPSLQEGRRREEGSKETNPQQQMNGFLSSKDPSKRRNSEDPGLPGKLLPDRAVNRRVAFATRQPATAPCSRTMLLVFGSLASSRPIGDVDRFSHRNWKPVTKKAGWNRRRCKATKWQVCALK